MTFGRALGGGNGVIMGGVLPELYEGEVHRTSPSVCGKTHGFL